MQLGGAAGGGSVPRAAARRRLTRPSGPRDANNNSLPPRRTTSATRSRSSSINTRGRSSGGGGGSIRASSTGRYSPPASVPGTPAGGGAVPNINAYLGGDTGYQQQLREFAKALADFRADVTRRRGVMDQEFGVSKKALGDQRVLDLENIEDDYSSRGLQRSGLYADAVGDYEKEFGTRMSELQRRQQQAIQQLLQQQSQFTNQNTLSQQAARESALRRRAERYGV